MTITGLKTRFSKNRSDENKGLFCKQKNLCISLLRTSKNITSQSLMRNRLQIGYNSGRRINPFN